MQTLNPIDPSTAHPKAKELLVTFESLRGRSSNMLRVLAQSPAILEAYLNFNRSFDQTHMSPKLRALITIVVAQSLDCDYMLSLAHAIAARQAVSPEEFEAARTAKSSDPKISQALSFAKRMVEMHGKVERSEVAAVQRVGYTDEEIVEIIAAIALNIFRNYFNLAVHTEVDFPRIRASQSGTEKAAGK